MTMPCAHPDAIPVESGSELVAALCPTCDTQLPAAWFTCDHPNTIEISVWSEPHGRMVCLACGATYWEEHNP